MHHSMYNPHDQLVQQAADLAPLLHSTAREAELARQPLDKVIDAVRETDIFGMFAPKLYGGLEADLDTFFDVALQLSSADPAMGWLIGFYIEHNLWYCHFPQHVQDTVYGNSNYALSPGTINVAGGTAEKVEGGYRVTGRWQWGTGIVHASWVMVGAFVPMDEQVVPMMFLLPRDQVNAIDDWHIAGMCATRSHDIQVEDVFVADDYAQSFADMLNVNTDITKFYESYSQIWCMPMKSSGDLVGFFDLFSVNKFHALNDFCQIFEAA